MHAAGAVGSRGLRARMATAAVLVAALFLAVGAPSASGSGLDRIRQSGRIKLGYRPDARPFSYKDESGGAAGYTVTLCQRVAEAIKAELGLPGLGVEWVPVTVEGRFRAAQQGDVDLLCDADTVTLERRKGVAFSIPTFPGGIGALVRTDAPARLKDVLGGEKPPQGPSWRTSAGQILRGQSFSVVGGTTAETWLRGKLDDFQLTARIVAVDGYDRGVRQVLDRGADAFFGDRAILLDAVARNPEARDLTVLDRHFTYEPMAIGLARGDDDLRLVVDRALSRLYASADMSRLYAKWFGEPDPDALAFFRWNRLPE